jgi:glucoamylase
VVAGRVWFTLGHGILNEVFWPRIDRPQLRDLGFIVADGAGFWSEVKRDAEQEVTYPSPGVPAILVAHHHRAYRLGIRICADNHADVVRIEVRLADRRAHAGGAVLPPLRLYALIAPHLGFTGVGNRAWAGAYKGRRMLFAQRAESALALAADPPPARLSVGFVGVSDGWQDFNTNSAMTWRYDTTGAGNVAGMAELVLADDVAQLALAFGQRPEQAALQASASLAGHFQNDWDRYVGAWTQFSRTVSVAPHEIEAADRDLYLISAAVLRTHQDATEPGATVASLATPWGNTSNDVGGYHLVWSRDLVETASAFVALGLPVSARQALAYLVASQEPDGHWPQNQWVDGVAYWRGVQLDEATYPILLVGALRQSGATQMHGKGGETADEFAQLLTSQALDRMIASAARFIVRTGPATDQDRWEETAGLTPSTLAPVVAALVVASRHLPEPAASYCLELADDWNASIEDWTFASRTSLAGAYGVDGHYVRIAAAEVAAGAPISTPVHVQNRLPEDSQVPADAMVGTDFLALVRFGLRRADDPRILSSLVVADGELRSDTPSGPVWHRYSGDGYGEHADGTAFDGLGVGRGWPLLVGERGHYELAAGRDPRPYLRAMRRMTSAGGMLPEQVWDTDDIPTCGLRSGKPSGSAMPLAWAHAEYIKLVRSIALGHPIDRPEPAWQRYHGLAPNAIRATWRFAAPRPTMPFGRILRLELLAPARARISVDGWHTWLDLESRDTTLGVWLIDVEGSERVPVGAAFDFTFWWPAADRWEGRNFRVTVAE